MLCGGVAAFHRYCVCTVRCVECTQHRAQYTYHTYDMLPHRCITYNDVVLTELYPKYNFS